MSKLVQPKPPQPSVDSVRQYLREIGRYPLLTHEQEINFGKQVQSMLHLLEQRHALTQQLEREATDAEWAAAAGLEPGQLQQVVREGDRAKRRLVEANLRLVVSVAKKYQKLNMEMLDLLQEGGIGLQRAAEKFDPTKGYRFSTYSYWWIRQAMTRAISEQSRTVRLPVHMTEKLGKIKKAQRQLSSQLGRKATIEEIAELLELKPQQIKDCLFQSRQPISLDVKIGTDQKTELSELLEDEGQTPDEYAMLDCLKSDLDHWMLDLTPQQRQVLRLRYGLVDNQPMTLQQIAEILKLTRERIRQIEHAAIKRLRQRQEGMGSYLAG
jgi:RNA polymerase nonessential primary-like sigma factor